MFSVELLNPDMTVRCMRTDHIKPHYQHTKRMGIPSILVWIGASPIPKLRIELSFSFWISGGLTQIFNLFFSLSQYCFSSGLQSPLGVRLPALKCACHESALCIPRYHWWSAPWISRIFLPDCVWRQLYHSTSRSTGICHHWQWWYVWFSRCIHLLKTEVLIGRGWNHYSSECEHAAGGDVLHPFCLFLWYPHEENKEWQICLVFFLHRCTGLLSRAILALF